jgi:hypothetical protein
MPQHSAAVKSSARFIAVLLLRHLGIVANEFSENRNRLFARIVDPINTHAVISVGVFRNLEQIGGSGVVKFHGQGIWSEDVVCDVTAPLSGDVIIRRRVGHACRTNQRQNYNRYKPRAFHGTTLSLLNQGRRQTNYGSRNELRGY